MNPTIVGEIRKNIVNADLVDCIIAMPTQLFYTTQIPVSLWFISKRKKQPLVWSIYSLMARMYSKSSGGDGET